MGEKRSGNTGGVVPFLITVALFGILVPWWKGLEVFDPLLFLVSLAVPLVFVTPVATDNGAQLTAPVRASRAFLYTAIMTVLIGIHLIAVVNFTHWFGHILLPTTSVFISAVLAIVIAEGCLSVFSVWLDQRTNAERARLVVRVIFGMFLAAYLYLFRFAPPSLRNRIDEQMTSEGLTSLLLGMAALLAVAAVGFALLLRRSDSGRSAV